MCVCVCVYIYIYTYIYVYTTKDLKLWDINKTLNSKIQCILKLYEAIKTALLYTVFVKSSVMANG